MTTTLADLIAPGCRDSLLHFIDEDEVFTLGEMWRRGESIAAWNAAHGGPPVAAVLSNSSSCVATVIGAIRAGITFVSLPAPPRGADPMLYARFVADACNQVGATTVAVDSKYLALLPPLPHISFTSFEAMLDCGRDGQTRPSDFALVQFTSGSTASPKGVVLGQRKLVANVEAILDWLRPAPGDGVCTWLPLSHDMGLIGMLLSSLAGSGPQWTNGHDIVILTPEGFVQNPQNWLAACSEYRSTVTTAPSFGFELAVKRRGSGSLDLDRLRVCITGAEPVGAAGLRRFAKAFADSGFSSSAFCPAYGLAEASLAVTITEPEAHWSSVTLDPDALAEQEVVSRSGGVELVGCGSPLSGMEVLVDTHGSAVGEILVRGPSVLDRYSTGEPGTNSEGWLRTADLGFFKEGELHVVGRKDDMLIVAGRNIFAGDLETHVADLPGVRPGRSLVAQNQRGDLVVLAEPEADVITDRSSCSCLADSIRRRVSSRCGVAPRVVAILPRGRLPMTASGKRQRISAIRALEEGRLEVLDGSIG
jgi:acyl-CoA synthetase (AMP-forming)/AMP-acid ligase II